MEGLDLSNPHAQERQRGPQLRNSENNVGYNGLDIGEPLLSVVRRFRLVVRGTRAGMDSQAQQVLE
eukprot:4112215-Prymnesium_polylepis.2